MSLLKQIAGKISDTESKVVRVDGATEGLIVISHTETAIHEGKHFYIEGYLELDNNDTFYVKLVTPDSTTWGHMIWDITSTGLLITEFYEGASGGMTGGTAVTPLNSNRNSNNTSVLTITKNVSAPTSTGTTLSSQKIGTAGSGSGVFSSPATGGSDSKDREIVLKQNTTYCRKFLSGSDSNIINFRASWIEMANKN